DWWVDVAGGGRGGRSRPARSRVIACGGLPWTQRRHRSGGARLVFGFPAGPARLGVDGRTQLSGRLKTEDFEMGRDWFSKRTIGSLVDDRATRDAERPALGFERRQWTVAELGTGVGGSPSSPRTWTRSLAASLI